MEVWFMPRGKRQVELSDELETNEPETNEVNEPEAPDEAPDESGRERRNGITRPGEDTLIGRIWAIADEITEDKARPAFRDEVISRFMEEVSNANQTTGHTQYARWQKFHDYGDALREAKAELKAEKERAVAEAKEKAKQERAAARAKRSEDSTSSEPESDESEPQGFVGTRAA